MRGECVWCGATDEYIHKFAHCRLAAGHRLALLEKLVQYDEALTVADTLQTPRLEKKLQPKVLQAVTQYLDDAQLTNVLVGAREQMPDSEEDEHTEIPPWEDPDQSSSEETNQREETTRRPRTLMDYFRQSRS